MSVYPYYISATCVFYDKNCCAKYKWMLFIPWHAHNVTQACTHTLAYKHSQLHSYTRTRARTHIHAHKHANSHIHAHIFIFVHTLIGR